MTIHGGDIWQVARQEGIDPSELFDFSANINPRGLPARALDRLARDAANPELLSLYPDRSASSLRRALSEKLDVDAESIVIGPGAEALLSPALRGQRKARGLLPVPAFGEYRRACEQGGIEAVPFPLERVQSFRIPVEELGSRMSGGFGVLFLNNPHNPSGACLTRREVRQIVDAARATHTLVLLDEAFIDYAPEASMTRDAAEIPGLIVLRSLTKIYGAPALRTGYLVAHPDTARLIASYLAVWPVTQLAVDAFAEAVVDREYIAATLEDNSRERDFLSAILRQLGFTVFPSAANYLLLELGFDMPTAAELRCSLIRHHRVLIRNCDSYEGLASGRFVRVAIRSRRDNLRLIESLTDELARAPKAQPASQDCVS